MRLSILALLGFWACSTLANDIVVKCTARSFSYDHVRDEGGYSQHGTIVYRSQDDSPVFAHDELDADSIFLAKDKHFSFDTSLVRDPDGKLLFSLTHYYHGEKLSSVSKHLLAQETLIYEYEEEDHPAYEWIVEVFCNL